MDDKHTPYHLPEGFNPYTAMDAIRGLTDAIYQFLLEGPGTADRIAVADKAGLNELLEYLQAEVHALHEYLLELQNSTDVALPLTEEEIDTWRVGRFKHNSVKDTPGVYNVN